MPPLLLLLALVASESVVLGPLRNERAISNLGRVTPTIYRSAQPSEEGFRRLAAMGIRTVVNLRETPDDPRLLQSLGLRAVHIPMDARTPPDETQARIFFDAIDDRRNLPVLVHCRFGKDRTGVMIGRYRMDREGWSSDSAIAEMRAYGHESLFLPRLTQHLRERGARPPVESSRPTPASGTPVGSRRRRSGRGPARRTPPPRRRGESPASIPA